MQVALGPDQLGVGCQPVLAVVHRAVVIVVVRLVLIGFSVRFRIVSGRGSGCRFLDLALAVLALPFLCLLLLGDVRVAIGDDGQLVQEPAPVDLRQQQRDVGGEVDAADVDDRDAVEVPALLGLGLAAEDAVTGDHRQQDGLGDPFDEDDPTGKEQAGPGGIQVLVDLPPLGLRKLDLGQRECLALPAQHVLVLALAVLDSLLVHSCAQRDNVLDSDAAGQVGRVCAGDDLDPAGRALRVVLERSLGLFLQVIQ